MDLEYNYIKIKKIAKEVKKSYTIGSMVEIVQYIFTDEDVLAAFIREGLDCKDNAEADKKISNAMQEGLDFFDIQQEVIKGLINANFYKKELTEILENLKTPQEQ